MSLLNLRRPYIPIGFPGSPKIVGRGIVDNVCKSLHILLQVAFVQGCGAPVVRT